MASAANPRRQNRHGGLPCNLQPLRRTSFAMKSLARCVDR